MYVIGDIHGDYDALMGVLSQIDGKDHIVFLGDLVDRGPDSIGVVRKVSELVGAGKATLIVGNHDDKFYRWFLGNRVMIRGGIEITIDQYNTLTDQEQKDFKEMYMELIDNAYIFWNTPEMTLAHASYHSLMPHFGKMTYSESRNGFRQLASKAFYGESYENDESGKPIRSYGWFKNVPNGHKVYIGHDVINTDEIVVKETPNGGFVHFIDTGCQKNGKLSFLKI